MRRRLPVIVDKAIAEGHAARIEVAGELENTLKDFAVASGEQVSCQKGCANCCYFPFSISLLEGIHLYRWLASHGKWTPSLRTSLEANSKRVWGLSPAVWLFSMIPCPMLANETCSAYEARPFRCRATFSMDDPALCHPHNTGGPGGVLPHPDAIEEFGERESKIMRRIGLQRLLVPLSTSLLFAERFCSGDLDEDTIDTEMLRAFEGNLP